MKITIDSSVLEKDGFTLTDFAVVLYYLGGGTGVLNETLCSNLREQGFLKKVSDGYQFHEGKRTKIRSWIIRSNTQDNVLERLSNIAQAMQKEFPEGKKSSKYYWRDSTKVITQRLALFIKKYGDYDDEDFVNAAREYVKSFNGNYEFMQLLKYFIYKKDTNTGEESSQLASYLDNAGESSLQEKDWTTNLI